MAGKSHKKRSKQTKPSAVSKWWSDVDEERRKSFASYFMKIAFGVAMLVAAVVGMGMLENRVLTASAAAPGASEPGNYRVKLADVPSWMPATLAAGIEQSLHVAKACFNDRLLAAKICEQAESNPWVRSVGRVEKRVVGGGKEGIVFVRVEFREPIAKVLHPDRMGESYVDAEGVRLPSEGAPKYCIRVKDGADDRGRYIYFTNQAEAPKGYYVYRWHYILIDGVASDRPKPGEKWPVDDIADGVRLVKLLSTRVYANQFPVVNVANHGGRVYSREPHIVIYAQQGQGTITLIKWGRFPGNDGPPVVSPQRKMGYLDEFARKNDGRIAGTHDWLDLRHDYLMPSIH